MHTPVCDRLAIEFPIFAFSHCRDVVAAVTNAGGFGVLGATGHSPRTLDIDLTWIDEQTKGKPYGVDLLLPAKYEETSRARESRFPVGHQAFVDDLLTRYGVPELPGHIPAASGAISVSAQDADSLLDVAFGHPIRLVASALGPPPAELVTRAHDSGVVVAALVGTAEHARRQQAAGVDLIVAQGTEAGGHTGTISTMVLVPEVIRAVHPTPVLAAGGIVTGAQVAAAMALGAQVGSTVAVRSSSVTLGDAAISGSFALQNASSSTQLVLTDSAGAKHTIELGAQGVGNVDFTLDRSKLGLPAGSYTLAVQTSSSETPAVDLFGTLQSVRLSASGSVVMNVDGLGEVAATQVSGFLGKTGASQG